MACRQGHPILEVQVPHLIPAEKQKRDIHLDVSLVGEAGLEPARPQ